MKFWLCDKITQSSFVAVKSWEENGEEEKSDEGES